MVQTVVEANELNLNSQRYRVDGNIHVTLLEGFAQKLVLGDFTPQNYRRRSVVRWADFSMGMGQQIVSPQDNQVNLRRSWWSTSHTRNRGHILLPPLVNAMTGEVGSSVPASTVLFGGQFYVNMEQNVLRTTTSSDNLSDTNFNTTNVNLTALSGRFNGTDYIIWGQDGSGYEFSTDGSSYSTGGREAHLLAQWDDRLWGFDFDDLQLWWAFEPSTTTADHTNDALLPIETGTVLAMFTGPDAVGEEIIYVLARDALWAHDAANSRFIKTTFQIFNPAQVLNSLVFPTVWRGAIYIPVGMNVWEYRPGVSIRAIGPDFETADDPSGLSAVTGLPGASVRGGIRTLMATSNEILAATDGSLAGFTIPSQLLSWNSRGWSVVWESASGLSLTGGVSSVGIQTKSSTSPYRVWFNDNISYQFIDLPTDITNPKQNTAYRYDSSAIHILPWLDVGTDSNPIALRTKVEAIDLSSNETVTLSYRTDLSNHTDISGFTTLGSAMISDGTTSFAFPDTSTSEGLSFRSHIQFKLALARGGTDTNSPDALSLSFEYYQKPNRNFAFDFVLDTREPYGDADPTEQFFNLMNTLEGTNTLLELTYRDTSITQQSITHTYYVEITEYEIIEENTGSGHGAKVRIRAEEI